MRLTDLIRAAVAVPLLIAEELIEHGLDALLGRPDAPPRQAANLTHYSTGADA